jgi:hypothetical protein
MQILEVANHSPGYKQLWVAQFKYEQHSNLQERGMQY